MASSCSLRDKIAVVHVLHSEELRDECAAGTTAPMYRPDATSASRFKLSAANALRVATIVVGCSEGPKQFMHLKVRTPGRQRRQRRQNDHLEIDVIFIHAPILPFALLHFVNIQ